ncbi:hypothetical protein GCM10010341_51160 [Streptomyces noursei]|nr:hypothetical protein GCM10010341_51160 [Streptomyces noursei]
MVGTPAKKVMSCCCIRDTACRASNRGSSTSVLAVENDCVPVRVRAGGVLEQDREVQHGVFRGIGQGQAAGNGKHGLARSG